MKQQLAAIAFNEKELEAYVSHLQSLHFETVSEVKKADDGSYYQVFAKTSRSEAPSFAGAPKAAEATVPEA